MRHWLFEEIETFKNWSRQLDQTPEEERTGKWEGAYAHWDAVDSAFVNFISTSEPATWTGEMTEAVLYIIARDHASEIFADLVAAQPEVLLHLTRQAVDAPIPAAKWQLVARLPEVTDAAMVRSLLLRFAEDPDEHVRSRALQTLAALPPGHP